MSLLPGAAIRLRARSSSVPRRIAGCRRCARRSVRVFPAAAACPRSPDLPVRPCRARPVDRAPAPTRSAGRSTARETPAGRSRGRAPARPAALRIARSRTSSDVESAQCASSKITNIGCRARQVLHLFDESERRHLALALRISGNGRKALIDRQRQQVGDQGYRLGRRFVRLGQQLLELLQLGAGRSSRSKPAACCSWAITG